MISARIAEALANQRRLYGKVDLEFVADLQRPADELQRLIAQAGAGGDIGALLDQIGRQANGIAQMACRGAAAVRARAAHGGGK